MSLTIADAVVLTFVPYFIIVFCNIKILKSLKCQQLYLSAASKRVQSDLNRVLLAQAVIPVFSAFLPMSLHIFSAIIDYDFAFISFICGIFYAWIPIGNAITIFIFITAYRKKLMQLIFRTKTKHPHIMPATSTVPSIP